MSAKDSKGCSRKAAPSAAPLSLAVNATGTATGKVTVLMTAEDIDAAVKKTTSYRAPGK